MEGDGHINYLDYGKNFTCVFVCQNLSNCRSSYIKKCKKLSEDNNNEKQRLQRSSNVLKPKVLMGLMYGKKTNHRVTQGKRSGPNSHIKLGPQKRTLTIKWRLKKEQLDQVSLQKETQRQPSQSWFSGAEGEVMMPTL